MTAPADLRWLSPTALHAGGPRGLVKATERTLWNLGFEDVRVIDGSGDKGADILAVRGHEEWVIQAKWSSSGPVDSDGVNEVNQAFQHYRADKAVLVTNTYVSLPAQRRADALRGIGLDLTIWNGATLAAIGAHMPDKVEGRHQPREYQTEAVKDIEADLLHAGRALLILATGLGKTVVGGQVISRHLDRQPNARILVVSHLKELSAQLETAMWHHIPKTVGTDLLTGDSRPISMDGVLAATVESAVGAVHEGYRPDLIMIDEAHHVGKSGRYRQLLELLRDTPFFGVTATPWRGDEFDLSTVFGEPSYTMGIAEGMACGWLSNVDYRMFVDNVDWDLVKGQSENGYSIGDLNSKLFLPQRDSEIIEHLLLAWNQTVEPRAIVFCKTIEHAEEFARLLRRSHPAWRTAKALHSEVSPQTRNVVLNEFKLGRTPILTSVDILNEGVDVPDVNIIAFLRVTHSRRIFVQQLGRGLRLAANKDKLRVLDFVTDIRRVQATLKLGRELDGEVERLHLDPRSTEGFTFSDETNGTLLAHWLRDAADVENAADEVRLQFPPELM